MTEKTIFYKHYVPLESLGVRFETIENRQHNPGFPDTVYFKKTGNGTVETKCLSKMKEENRIDWRPFQLAKNHTLQRFSDKVFLVLWIEGIFYLTKTFKSTYSEQELQEEGGICLLRTTSLSSNLTTLL